MAPAFELQIIQLKQQKILTTNVKKRNLPTS